MHLRLVRGHQVDQCVYTHPDRYLLLSAAEDRLGNAIRCTKHLQSDEQGTETAVERLLPETLRLFHSASFREVAVDPRANQTEAGIEEDRLRTEVFLGHSAPTG